MARAKFVAIAIAAVVVGVAWALPTAPPAPAAPADTLNLAVCRKAPDGRAHTLHLSLSAAVAELTRGVARPGSCEHPSRSLAAELRDRAVSSDLSTKKTVLAGPGRLTYQVVVTNVGPSSSVTSSLADRFSESGSGSIALLTPTVSKGSCTPPSPPSSVTSMVQTFSCSLPSLDPNQAVTVTIQADCSASITGPAWVVTNTATATVSGDTDPTNDADTRVVTQCTTSPTAVRVNAFAARSTKRTVLLEWRTATELDAAGFNVFRTNGGVTRRVNASPITPRGHNGVGGSTYRLVDREVHPGRFYTYRLQVVRLDGTMRWFGSLRIRAQ